LAVYSVLPGRGTWEMRLGEKKPLQGMETGWRGEAMSRAGKKLDRGPLC